VHIFATLAAQKGGGWVGEGNWSPLSPPADATDINAEWL
jgi:hypothetical protein